ncbi:flagellar brake protein [Thermoanaerobacterium sp. RBIITD]|uniref:flagellar brake protein n=1 Tax=Thermoanaerobacterium sp. RBIITD TaxID=1550240 RepID=UPI000BB786E1|nr:flagellar brake protein [Thermoanaerobacterium sp. RBIITD]SNX55498.1 c-di-GMP-binding flagellar brake protein YcgR, contains PilZNR and PilZ domains [Thermoanaerobacterium sp. RBIITD]
MLNLKPGQKIEIKIGKSKNTYVSKVEDMSKDGTLLIEAPIHNGHLVPVRIGAKLNISYFNKKGLFTFDSIVINRFSGNLSLLQLKKITDITRLQRRQYYRLEKVLEFNYKLSEDEEGVENGIIKDISGGGFKAKVKKKLPEESTILCYIKLNELFKEIMLKCKIIRCNFVDDGYEIAVQYIDLEDKIRERIISFIFEEQRKLKKRETEY